MEFSEFLPRITIAIIIAVIVISGPIVPSVDFTTFGISAAIADNERATLSVSDITVPDTGYRIVPGRYEWQAVLDVPPVKVRVLDVTGSPVLIYEVEVKGLGHLAATLVAVNPRDIGQDVTLDIHNSTLRTNQLDQSSYPGAVSIRVRTGNESRTVFRKNVTVVVEGFDEQ